LERERSLLLHQENPLSEEKEKEYNMVSSKREEETRDQEV
jgi:hypothetical protein